MSCQRVFRLCAAAPTAGVVHAQIFTMQRMQPMQETPERRSPRGPTGRVGALARRHAGTGGASVH
jgi:hypothetical protein